MEEMLNKIIFKSISIYYMKTAENGNIERLNNLSVMHKNGQV